ncbi:uncharacterized protein LOC129757592 [Uranotaenia lowii]|uniref:uncharacterized protein LOC129757592 n=1 Tax=Uranotaenia lowii TaxID=190385 RepID=UPI002479F197|nr:uncharacterized protein LOC129757592 [Uranotaenia lowii]
MPCILKRCPRKSIVVVSHTSKIVAQKGVRQTSGVSSAERGTNTTVVFAMSAAGSFVPPMFIFARQRMHETLKKAAPTGAIFDCAPKGWSNAKCFEKWFDHFLKFTRHTEEEPILLILDGHSSHTRNFCVLEKATENHVRILSISPHTSHKLQPLDVAFMAPLKANYSTAVGHFLRRQPGSVVGIHDVAGLVNEAFSATASVMTAANGFRACGIHPFNPNIFSNEDFAAADFLAEFNDHELDKLLMSLQIRLRTLMPSTNRIIIRKLRWKLSSIIIMVLQLR